MKIWFCKIGETLEVNLPHAADEPMRKAIIAAYLQTAQGPHPISSFQDGEGNLPSRKERSLRIVSHPRNIISSGWKVAGSTCPIPNTLLYALNATILTTTWRTARPAVRHRKGPVMDKFKPCPFCGDENPRCYQSEVSDQWHVVCSHCNAKTDNVNTKKIACKQWNTRDERELTALKLAATEQATQTPEIINKIDANGIGVHSFRFTVGREYTAIVHEDGKMTLYACGIRDVPDVVNSATQAEAVLKERTRERDEAEQANELDRRSLFAVVRAIDEEIRGRMWLIEGRGAYESKLLPIHVLQEKLEPLRKIAGDLTKCPKTEKGVNSVRKLERERDALALSQGRLLGMLRDWRMNLYPRDHAKYCRASVKYPDWPDPKDDRCDLCKKTDAAIAEATPQEEKNASSTTMIR